jgi:hypothetical protein
MQAYHQTDTFLLIVFAIRHTILAEAKNGIVCCRIVEEATLFLVPSWHDEHMYLGMLMKR